MSLMKTEEEIIQIRMYVPTTSSTSTYDVIKIDSYTYQLVNNAPFNENLIYGTIIEVHPEEKEEGVLEFKKIFAESTYNLEVIILPTSLAKHQLRAIGELIIDEGGFWEVIFGGLGYINLPKHSKLDVMKELNKLIDTTNDNT